MVDPAAGGVAGVGAIVEDGAIVDGVVVVEGVAVVDVVDGVVVVAGAVVVLVLAAGGVAALSSEPEQAASVRRAQAPRARESVFMEVVRLFELAKPIVQRGPAAFDPERSCKTSTHRPSVQSFKLWEAFATN